MRKLLACLIIFSLFHSSTWGKVIQAGAAQPDLPVGSGELDLVARFDFTNPLGMIASGNGASFDYAFVGLQKNLASEVVVLDLTNPSMPAYLAAVPFETPGAYPLLLVGDLLYVGLDGGDLRIFDISTPSSPVQVGGYSLITAVGNAPMVASGNIAYMAHNSLGLIVLDISDPANPAGIGAYSETGFSTVAIQGSIAYTIGWDELYIFDVSNPALPELLSNYQLENNRWFENRVLAVKDGYAYIAGIDVSSGSVESFAEVIDISNPSQPTKAADLPQLAVFPRNLVFSGSMLYVVTDGGMVIFDASSPLDPQPIGMHQGLSGLGVQNLGDKAAFLDQIAGFQVLDVADPANPTLLGLYNWPQNPNHLYAVGSKLYTLNTYWINLPVYDVHSMLQVIDITNPITPTVSGNVLLDAYGLGRPFVDDPYVYVTTVIGLQIIDASDPVHMKSALIGLNGYTLDVEVKANTAYALSQSWESGQGWLSAIDVTNPMTSTLLGQIYLDDYVTDLSVAQQGGATIAYLTTLSGWLAVDITEPATPVVVFQDNSTPEMQRVVTINLGEQTIAYLARSDPHQYSSPDEGVVAMDVSDPANPLNLGIYRTEMGTPSVLMADDALVYYTDSSTQDFTMIDFINPANPLRVGSLNVPVYSWLDAALTQDYIIAVGESADVGGNVYIFSKTSHLDGRVTDHNYQPMGGVNLALSSGDSTVTDGEGFYSFSNLTFGSIIVTPTLEGFAFYPPYREIALPGSSENQNFVVLAAPVSTTLEAGITTTLTYTDVQGLPTRFTFPPGSVPITGTATVTPTLADAFFGTDFAGHAFDLAVQTSVTNTRNITYPIPVTVTIGYSELDAAVITDTARLTLFRWDESAWVEAGDGCPGGSPPPIQNPGIYQTAVCQDGRYGLFGPTHGIAIPQAYYGSDVSEYPISP